MLERLTNGRKSSRRQSAFLYVLFRIDLIVFSCDLSLSIAIAIGENFLSVLLSSAKASLQLLLRGLGLVLLVCFGLFGSGEEFWAKVSIKSGVRSDGTLERR
jgi:hypothetical protein